MFEWFKRLLHKYDDYKEVGEWGSIDTRTGETIAGGKMYSRTIKVENEDGSIGLDSEWIPDFEVKKEQNGEWIEPE